MKSNFLIQNLSTLKQLENGIIDIEGTKDKYCYQVPCLVLHHSSCLSSVLLCENVYLLSILGGKQTQKFQNVLHFLLMERNKSTSTQCPVPQY